MQFSMQGSIQFSSRLVDGKSVLSEAVVVPTVLTDGTTAGKADGYWSKTVSLPSGDDTTLDLTSLSFSSFGLSGTVAFESVKHLAILNESPNVTLTVEPGASDGWDAFAGMTIGKAGALVAYSGVAGLTVTSTSKTVKITNDGVVTALSGNTTKDSASVKSLSSTASLAAGMTVTGSGIPAGAKVASVTNSTDVLLTANATATATGVSLDFSWPDAGVKVYVSGILD